MISYKVLWVQKSSILPYFPTENTPAPLSLCCIYCFSSLVCVGWPAMQTPILPEYRDTPAVTSGCKEIKWPREEQQQAAQEWLWLLKRSMCLQGKLKRTICCISTTAGCLFYKPTAREKKTKENTDTEGVTGSTAFMLDSNCRLSFDT